MKKLKQLLIAITCTIGLSAYTQDSLITCGSDDVNTGLFSADELLMNNLSSIVLDEVITIPVVVHIMHVGEDLGEGSNISDEQILSAITATNEDFRKVPGSTGDGNGVDVEVQFCLATVDPDGNPTNGIIRVDATSIDGYAEEGIAAGSTILGGVSETAVKDLSKWPRESYYNIWVVPEIRNNNGGNGVQGYAYFPNASAARDGTVILYNAFGTVGTLKPYTALNKVTTHELGHAFFLYHSFQGNSCNETDCETQGDRVCDTPPTFQNNSCSSPACQDNDVPQQVENYMDYTSQSCQNMFTQGQKDRMRNAIFVLRPTLLESNGCDPIVAECVGDLNNDNIVDVADFIQLNSMFGAECDNCIEDLNNDGIIDTADFIVLNTNFGNTCGEQLILDDYDIIGRRK